MKIKDIVVESDIGDVASLSAKNVGAGYDAVNKLFSPSQWFKGSVKTDDEPVTQKKSSSAKPKISSTSHLERETITDVSQGKQVFRSDISHLKTVYGKVKSGKISVDDVDSTLLSLKAAINGQQLSDQQKAVLAQLAKQL